VAIKNQENQECGQEEDSGIFERLLGTFRLRLLPNQFLVFPVPKRQTRFRPKLEQTGFISFKGVRLMTPDTKARLRKIRCLLESVAKLVLKIDYDEKEALNRFTKRC
jgi:hypothetical protein